MLTKFNVVEKLLLRSNILPHPLIDAGAMVTAGRALIASVKLGIIDELAEGPKPASELADKLNISERGAEIVLDCLEPIGYVKKAGSQYALTKTSRKFLTRDSPHTMRHMVLLAEQTYNSYFHLEDTIKRGAPERQNLDDFSEKDWEIFTKAMIDLARANKDEVAKKVKLPRNPQKLLDIGGSHGLYSIELCKRYSSLSAEVMDLEQVKPYAEDCIKENGMEDRVHYRVGDLFKDELGNGYDCILAFNMIHALDNENNRHLAQRCHQSLNEGGVLVILDQIKGIGGNTSLSKLITSFMALNLLQQAGGNTYTFPEVKTWLQHAGFQDVKLKKLQAPGFGLVIGRK